MTAAAGEWVFRHAGGCLLDTPDLPVPLVGLGWRWVATVWPDPLTADGWDSFVWAPGERGWQLPLTLAIGDVVEFGITSHDPWGRPLEAHTHRWYGWLDHATDLALIIRGPYPHPRPAVDDARPVIDELRLDQLDPPVEAIIDAIGFEQFRGR
jgi:hypothetical protein